MNLLLIVVRLCTLFDVCLQTNYIYIYLYIYVIRIQTSKLGVGVRN